jgi:DNA-binding transcriptional MerR regulator
MLIGALAARAGLSAKTIRFYEQAGLLPEPPRTPAGYRDYPPAMLARLSFIGQAQAAGSPWPRSVASWPSATAVRLPAAMSLA